MAMSNFEQFIEDVKSRVEITEAIKKYGEIKRSGERWVMVCPFHDDKNPSLTIYTETQSWHCFGCGKSGDIFEFVMELEHITFMEALKRISKEEGMSLPILSDKEREKAEESTRIKNILEVTAKYYQDSLTKEVVEYLEKDRGFFKETIQGMRLGYAQGGLKQYLVGQGFPEALCIKAGVVKGNGNDYFYNRITIPAGRNGGEVQIRGRLFGQNSGLDLPKYLSLRGPARLFNEDALRADKIILTEGEFDAITLIQCDFPAVGVPGATAFKEEWGPRFRGKEVWIAFDADKDPAKGPAGALRVGEILIRAGAEVKIMELPRAMDEDKVDINDLFVKKGYTKEVFQSLLTASEDFIRFEINQIPQNMEKSKLSKVLEPLLKQISCKSVIEKDDYVRLLAERFNLKRGSVGEMLTAVPITTANEQGVGQANAPAEILSQTFQGFTPAQCFVEDSAYFTVPLFVREEGRVKTRPYVVTSKRGMFPFNDAELLRRQLTADRELLIGNGLRWSRKSIGEFVDGGVDINCQELFHNTKGQYVKYMDFKDKGDASLISCWVIGTYLHRAFSAFPYLQINAVKQCGKSKCCELTTTLGFNGVMCVSFSAAYMFRKIQSTNCTLALDESEQLEVKHLDDDRRSIILSGYKRGGKVGRIEKIDDGQFRDQDFEVYCPKLISNIGGLEDILSDRCITIFLTRSNNKQITDRELELDSPELLNLRDDLYVLAMTHHNEIRQIYREIICEEISGREWEIWKPIYCLAQFFESKGVSGLLNEIQGLALAKSRRKRELSIEQSEHTKILGLFIEFIEMQESQLLEHLAGDKVKVVKSMLFDFIQQREPSEFKFLSPNKLGRILNTLQVIEKTTSQRDPENKNKSIAVYLISVATVRDARERLSKKEDLTPEGAGE